MVSVGLGYGSSSYAPGGSSNGGDSTASAVKYGITIGGSVGVASEMLTGPSQVGVGSTVSNGVGPV